MPRAAHAGVGLTIGVLVALSRAQGPPRTVALPRWDFVAIAPGEFMMGCSAGDQECGDEEKPRRRARIPRPFEIGKYEVTQAQWEAVMGANPSDFKGPERPVDRVSWNDAQEFLAAVSARDPGFRYRLPSEAEWEYAARAGSAAATYGKLDAIAWFGRNSGDQTHPVGQKQPNAWGLHDMLGNVWEWCLDWYGAGYYSEGALVDPRGPERGEFRVLRGGSWHKYLWFLRASSRFRERPDSRFRHVGFRCVREKL
jgi:formylglycine-generating enzyme required for sulfatase activity